MKKEETAHKMKHEECDKCGSMKHKTSEHKQERLARKEMKPTDEGDFGARYTEEKFSRKDLHKEKKERSDKKSLGGKSESKAWEI